jgi:mannosyltransferase OCH1-like enzyme
LQLVFIYEEAKPESSHFELFKELNASHLAPLPLFPRLIHVFVRNVHVLSDSVNSHLTSWRAQNPSYTIRLYDADDMRDVVMNTDARLGAVWETLETLEDQLEVFRYSAVYAFGGILVDVNTTCAQPIANWNAPFVDLTQVNRTTPEDESQPHLPQAIVGLVGGKDDPFRIHSWLFAATPRHPLFLSVLNDVLFLAKSKPTKQHPHFSLTHDFLLSNAVMRWVEKSHLKLKDVQQGNVLVDRVGLLAPSTFQEGTTLCIPSHVFAVRHV